MDERTSIEKELQAEQQFDDELAERIDRAAEVYWLGGMDLNYAKRRAMVELTRASMPESRTMMPIVRL